LLLLLYDSPLISYTSRQAFARQGLDVYLPRALPHAFNGHPEHLQEKGMANESVLHDWMNLNEAVQHRFMAMAMSSALTHYSLCTTAPRLMWGALCAVSAGVMSFEHVRHPRAPPHAAYENWT
jgi:hypothetical protein